MKSRITIVVIIVAAMLCIAAASRSIKWADSEIPSGTINGANATFTLAHTPTSGSLHLYLNGRRLKLADDYTIKTATITMASALASGDALLADYRY